MDLAESSCSLPLGQLWADCLESRMSSNLNARVVV